jgi:hypothetical protein
LASHLQITGYPVMVTLAAGVMPAREDQAPVVSAAPSDAKLPRDADILQKLTAVPGEAGRNRDMPTSLLGRLRILPKSRASESTPAALVETAEASAATLGHISESPLGATAALHASAAADVDPTAESVNGADGGSQERSFFLASSLTKPAITAATTKATARLLPSGFPRWGSSSISGSVTPASVPTRAPAGSSLASAAVDQAHQQAHQLAKPQAAMSPEGVLQVLALSRSVEGPKAHEQQDSSVKLPRPPAPVVEEVGAKKQT